MGRELLAADRMAGVPRQILQQVRLPSRQRNLELAAAHDAAPEVEHHPLDLALENGRADSPADECTHPRNQLHRVATEGNVVVGAAVERLDSSGGIIAVADDDDEAPIAVALDAIQRIEVLARACRAGSEKDEGWGSSLRS